MNEAYVYFLRGRVWFNQDSYAEAEADFAAAIQLGMDDADVYFRRGWARLSQGNYDMAEADFSAAIERGRTTLPSTYPGDGAG